MNLIFNDETKKIDVPNDIEDLEKKFYKEFNCDKEKVYIFNYLDSDDEDNFFDTDTDYFKYLDDYKDKQPYKIKVCPFEEENYEEEKEKKIEIVGRKDSEEEESLEGSVEESEKNELDNFKIRT